MSDWIIENAAQHGLFGASFSNHDQRSVVCTLTAGLLLVSAAGIISLLERLGIFPPPSRDRDWLVHAAHHITTELTWRALPPALLVALLVRYAMESAELLPITGHPATGIDWLGGPLLIAVAVHAACCALALLGLAIVMRSIDRAVTNLVSAVLALLAAFLRLVKPAVAVGPDCRRAVYRLSRLARLLGERGPPSLVAA